MSKSTLCSILGRMIPNPITIFNTLPKKVKILIFGTLINRLGGVIAPFLTVILVHKMKFEPSFAGTVIALYGSGVFLSILAGGWLTDVIGRRPTLLFSLFSSGIVAIVLGFCKSKTEFLILFVIFGFVVELYRPASSTMLTDMMPSNKRASAFAALRIAFNLGFTFASFVGGFLVDWNWRTIFWIDGITTLVFALIIAKKLPETKSKKIKVISAENKETDAQSKSQTPWKDPVFLTTLCLMIPFSMLYLSHILVLPLTVTQTAGLSSRFLGSLFAINGLGVVLFEMTSIEYLKKYRRLKCVAFGTILSFFGYAMIGLSTHWSWYILTTVIWTVGEIIALPMMISFISDWAPSSHRGQYMSLWQGSWSVAFSLSSFFFLRLHSVMPEVWFWIFISTFALPCAFWFLRLDKTADRPDLLRGLS